MIIGNSSAEVVGGTVRDSETGEAGEAAPFLFDFLPPPPDVEPYVTTYFSLRCDRARIDDVQPAAVALFLVFLKGEGRMRTGDGAIHVSHRTSLVTPLSAAAEITVEGPWHAFGAAIGPLGWAALTGRLSAAEWSDRMAEAGSLFGPEVTRLGESLIDGHRAGTLRPQDMVAMASRVFAARAIHIPPRHEDLIRAVAEWLGGALSPRLEDLVAATPYSPRQLQRLVDHHFGLSPSQLARKYRALRAAALLCHPGTPADQIAHVEEQFYDQPHMIREIRHFTGCTPGRLARTNQPLRSASVDLRNYVEIRPKVAAMPSGLGLLSHGHLAMPKRDT
jgi:AraC-like DNA-binding protein